MQHVYWVVDEKLGGRPGPVRFPWDPFEMKEAGVEGIVSLDGPVVVKYLQMAGIEHLSLPQPMALLEAEADHYQFLAVMPPVLAFVDRIRAMDKAVVVHCYYGCDRTGAVLSCYLVAREGYSADEAVACIRNANPNAMTAFGYAEVVTTFERLYKAEPKQFESG